MIWTGQARHDPNEMGLSADLLKTWPSPRHVSEAINACAMNKTNVVREIDKIWTSQLCIY